MEQIERNVDVRIDKDEHIPRGMTRTCVARAGDALYLLGKNRRPAGTCNGGGSIHAVVVHDDRLDVRVRPGGQQFRRGIDRVQSRGETGLLIEGGDNDRELEIGIRRTIVDRRTSVNLTRLPMLLSNCENAVVCFVP